MPEGTFKVGATFGWLSDDELRAALKEEFDRHRRADGLMRDADRPQLQWPAGEAVVPNPTADTYITLNLGPMAGHYWSVMSLFLTPADPATSVANVRSILYFIPSGWNVQQGVPHPHSAKDFTDQLPDTMSWSEDQMACPPERRIVVRLSGSGLVAGTRFFANAFCLEKPVSLYGLEPVTNQPSMNAVLAGLNGDRE